MPLVTTADDLGLDASIGDDLAADEADGGGLSLREAVYWLENLDPITFAPSLDG